MAPALQSVLVVGGCGFLGHHVVRLLRRDYPVCAVSVIDIAVKHNRLDGVSYHEADLTDRPRINEIFAVVRPQAIVHTASPPPHAATNTGYPANELFRRVNVDGTRTLLVAAQQIGSVRAFVYTSSASVISDNVSDLINADERWPVIRGAAQTSYYTETKAAAEQLVLEANRCFLDHLDSDGDTDSDSDSASASATAATTASATASSTTNEKKRLCHMLTCSIRPSGIFGEGDRSVLLHMVNLHRNGRTGVQVGDNNNMFDFTYVENVAHAHLLGLVALLAAADSPPADAASRVDGEAFLITNDSPVYFWDFCRAVWAYAGSTLGTDHVRVLPRSLGIVLGLVSELVFALLRRPATFNRQRIVFSCMSRYFNISKAKERLGYQPVVPLEQGLRQSVQWFVDEEKVKA